MTDNTVVTEFIDPEWHSDTLSVRAGSMRTPFGEHSEALFLTSSYVFDSAEAAAKRFKGEEAGYVYSRFTNPTVDMLQTRLAALEQGEDCLMTSSGMAAIMMCVLGLLSSGDHLVASRSIFGSTQQFFTQWLPKWGIQTTFVESTDPEEWKKAFTAQTRLVFIETPANPLTTIFDIQAIADVSHRFGALLAVDNCFCSPALQKPLLLGADIVIHSATKYLDGQGRVLGGAVVGSKAIIHDRLLPFLRTLGPSISPFNAWVILKGLETLSLRMFKQSENALVIAQWLEQHPSIERVYYPGLPSHSGYELAKKQQQSGGAILSFEIKGGQKEAWSLIDSTRLISITANLGDTRSTLTHPATTTHGRLTEEDRVKAGIRPSLLRMAVGLEHAQDLIRDLEKGVNTF